MLKKITSKVLAVALMAAASVPALAAPLDLTALSTAVDFGPAITAILAIASIICGLYVAVTAVKRVLGMVRSA